MRKKSKKSTSNKKENSKPPLEFNFDFNSTIFSLLKVPLRANAKGYSNRKEV